MSLWTSLQRPAMELMFSGEKKRRPTEVTVVQLLFPTRMAPWHLLPVEKMYNHKRLLSGLNLGNAWKAFFDNAVLPVRFSIPSDQTKAMAAGSYEFLTGFHSFPILNTHCNSDCVGFFPWIPHMSHMRLRRR